MIKKVYKKPAVVHTEPLVAVAAICTAPGGKAAVPAPCAGFALS